jgi:hypothetical protein
MRKILVETRGRIIKILSLVFIAPLAKFRLLYNKDTLLVFET